MGIWEGVEWLGDAVIQSDTIRKIRLLKWHSTACDSFLRFADSGISANYALCSVDVDSEFPCSLWQAHWLTGVRETACRNSGYVARAAQFLNHARCDTPCAAALDRVYRHPALLAELSKVLSISEADAVVAVQQRFRSIEGMHSSCDWPVSSRCESRVSHVTTAVRSWTPSTSTAGLA
ncbi:hypothetical protein HPB52_018582 [Rhipicephalus sanguineus]|uniref:Uncharacterized protein n=2 Tax=Rhipicephalus sanguineus TaxID=34632 RepID=A0A9D4SSP7_RHISA|nr:hypothetical protein HPB52_018582 [Rhipicephalus sanguineus]